MYLYEVKKPAESKGAWDYYKPVATILADQAFLPLAESKCQLVKKTQEGLVRPNTVFLVGKLLPQQRLGHFAQAYLLHFGAVRAVDDRERLDDDDTLRHLEPR